MRERLYNERGGSIAPHAPRILALLHSDGVTRVIQYCNDNNLDLRDAQSMCMIEVSLAFSRNILKDLSQANQGNL